MLRRKPVFLEIEQQDVDQLDAIRKKIREKAEADSAPDGSNQSVLEKTERELATDHLTARERLGLPRRTVQKPS